MSTILNANNCQCTIAECTWGITVTTPYNPRMISKYRGVGGEYKKDENFWALPKAPHVYALLLEEFNWVPKCKKFKMIEVKWEDDAVTESDGFLYYKGYILGSRQYRDSAVKIPTGVSTHGTYAWSGGSTKYPSVMTPSTDIDTWSVWVYDPNPTTRRKKKNPLEKYSTEELKAELERRLGND